MKRLALVLLAGVVVGCTAAREDVKRAEGVKFELFDGMAMTFRGVVEKIRAEGAEAEGAKERLLGEIDERRAEYRALHALVARWLELDDPLARVDGLVEQGLKILEAARE